MILTDQFLCLLAYLCDAIYVSATGYMLQMQSAHPGVFELKLLLETLLRYVHHFRMRR